jgi:flagellar biogenesis protein FliO
VKNTFFSTITASLPLLALPAPLRAAEEAALSVTTPQFTPLASMLAMGKLLVAFLIIAALMALLFRAMKKMGLGHGSLSKGGLISVLDTRLIAPKKYIAVVRVAGEDLAIGISDHGLSLLCKLGPTPPALRTDQGSASAFDTTLGAMDQNQTTEAAHA